MNKKQFIFVLTMSVILPIIVIVTLLYLPIRVIIRPTKLPLIVRHPIQTIKDIYQDIRVRYVLLNRKVPLTRG